MSLKGTVKPGYIITGRVTEIDYILITAYGIAVQHGFVGTEEEWLASLKCTSVNEETLDRLIREYFKDNPMENIVAGNDGITFYPKVDKDGNLSWINDGNKQNPATVNIKGVQGDKGERGEKGEQGERGEQGVQGEKGEKGDAGISPEKGVDYFTEDDKVWLVNAVIDALNNLDEVSY